eukprot:scaffold1112_cov116-Isochrysis_galbana.AAC.48
MSNPVWAVSSLRYARDRSCKTGRRGPGRARGQKMARKDGWPRAGKAATQTVTGGRTVPRCSSRKLGAELLAAAVAQRRARAGQAGKAFGHAEPADNPPNAQTRTARRRARFGISAAQEVHVVIPVEAIRGITQRAESILYPNPARTRGIPRSRARAATATARAALTFTRSTPRTPPTHAPPHSFQSTHPSSIFNPTLGYPCEGPATRSPRSRSTSTGTGQRQRAKEKLYHVLGAAGRAKIDVLLLQETHYYESTRFRFHVSGVQSTAKRASGRVGNGLDRLPSSMHRPRPPTTDPRGGLR